MSAVILPCQSTLPHFKFQSELDGTTYGFEFRWNERTQDWFMSIYDVNEVLLLGEQRVAAEWALSSRKAYDPNMPPGGFIVFDTSGDGLDPGLTDLGDRVQIIYYSPVQDGS